MSNESSGDTMKSNITNTSAWKRLLMMLLFTIIWSVAEIVIVAVVLFQFLSVLFTGNKNEKVLIFGAQLATFTYQVFHFLTYNTEQQPFPFADWPSATPLHAATPPPTTSKAPRKRTATKPATSKTAAPKRPRKDAPAAQLEANTPSDIPTDTNNT